MVTKESLAIIVGAGASVKAGIQSTWELNKIAARALPSLHLAETTYVPPSITGGAPAAAFTKVVPMADVLESAMRAYYKKYDVEILFHALEQRETLPHSRKSCDVTSRSMTRLSFTRLDGQLTQGHGWVGSNSQFPVGATHNYLA